MTLGAIVIPLAALALCAAGFALAWSLVRRAESHGDEGAAPPGADEQTPAEREQPAQGAAPQRPGGAVRIVGQLMALAGFALGMAGIVVVLWRAFVLHPIWLVVSLLAIGGTTAVLVWRIYRHGTVPPPSP